MRREWASLLGVCVAVSSASAAESTNAPPAAVPAPDAAAAPAETNAVPALTPEQMFEGGTNTYNNWVEVGVGGYFTHGSNAQAQQRRQRGGNAFGGIQDFHYSGAAGKGTTVSVDGRGLFDENDYKLRLEVNREKLGYARFSYNEFRTWYNGNGGFFPATGSWYPLRDDALALDRGELSFEAGLRLDKIPSITFKYTRTFREGDKSSTSWGMVHPGGDSLGRGLSPSVRDIDEHADIFQLDATHHIKATDFGVGLRYETAKLDDALKLNPLRGEPLEQKITDRQGTTYDFFNVHAFSETWLKKNLMFSSGLSYADLDADFSGSRIYGSDFDVNYVPSAQNGFGYYGLGGGSRMHEYVMNLNLWYRPTPHLSIVPSIRVQKEDTDASSQGTETLSDAAGVPFSANSDRGVLDVRERLDITYTGFTNWVLYARGELTEGDGNLTETGGLVPVNGTGIPPIQRETDDSRFFQKYSAGVRWYPTRTLSLDVGGYYKRNNYDYDHLRDSTANDSANRYPAYLVMQNFDTYDSYTRVTMRPLRNVTLVSRYEFQWSTVNTEPDPISGLPEAEASTMSSHIFAQDVTWSPWSRLYLQAGLNYVVSQTETPAADATRALLAAQNNYWTLNVSSGLVIDDRTDLNLAYLYYDADGYRNNSDIAVPFGAGASEHGITATLTRRIRPNIRASLKYGFYHYSDITSGHNNDYEAHLVYSSLQYRF